jgi:hypothetical protein
MVYDIFGINDEYDQLINSDKLKVWAIPRANHLLNLKCISDYLNEFGMRGGFEQILKLFVGAILDADGQKVKVSMRHVWLLLEFLSKTMPLW